MSALYASQIRGRTYQSSFGATNARPSAATKKAIVRRRRFLAGTGQAYPPPMDLPKQSFLALAAIGWVDGSLQRVEAVGLLRAAKQAGIGGDDLAEIEK